MASFRPDGLAETPPVLPPKPGSHEASRINTPSTAGHWNNLPTAGPGPFDHGRAVPGSGVEPAAAPVAAAAASSIPDPGDMWLPQVLQDKSKQDIADILASPKLLSAMTHASSSAHASVQASNQALQAALADNMDLASQVSDLEQRLAHQRSATQAQLLSTHTLERQWRQKQSAMDHALAPFSPASLYQRLGQGVQEQSLVCQAMEESFLDGDGDNVPVSEREAAEWVRKYRDAKVQYYLRQERKERWDEGRVGGWR